MQRTKPMALRRRAISVAVAAAIPVLLGSGQAYAACAGSISTPNSNAVSILCNNSGANPNGNLTVNANDVSTYVDTTGAGTTTYVTGGNKTLIQFDGHGRILTVNEGGQISDFRNVAGTRAALLMGASTTNASAATIFATQTLGANVNLLGADGTSVVATVNSGTAINAPSNSPVTVTYNGSLTGTLVKLNTGTLTNALVGQSLIFGRYDSADGDFLAGQDFKIIAYDAANRLLLIDGTLPADFAGSASASLQLVYSVVSNYGEGVTIDGVFYNNVVQNAGTISSRVQQSEINTAATGAAAAPYSSAIYGIRTSVAGDYLINNQATGTIRTSHAGIANAYAVEAGGQVQSLILRNAGLIESERTNSVQLTAVTAGANPQAKVGTVAYNAANLGTVAAVFAEEEAELIKVENASSGIIRSKGDFSSTLYLRAEEQVVVNDGLIEHLSSAGGTDYGKGFAIGSVSNGGEVRELNLTNNGTIHGDILAVNGSALRWYLLSTQGDTGAGAIGSSTAIAAGLDSRLLINSQTGQDNSEISNTGTIVGNIWLSNGEHEVENSGHITGNIDVDQRDTTYGTVSGSAVTVLTGSDDDINPATGLPFASNNTNQGAGFVIRGDKEFEFENEGTFTGNLNITNASSTFSGTYGTETITNKTVSSDNTIVNNGLFDGNITIKDVAGAENAITLIGDGFGRKADGSVNSASGNISAVNGTGENTLNLAGVGTLRGDVVKFTTLNLGLPGGSAPDDDDDDDDAGASSGPNWTLAAGKTFEFTDSAQLNTGLLNLQGTLLADTFVNAGATLTGSGTVNGNVTNLGTIDLAAGTLNVSGDALFKTDSVLRTLIAPTAHGQLAVTGLATFEHAALLKPVIQGATVKTGDTYTVLTSTGLNGRPDIVSNGLVQWVVANDPNNLVLTANVNSANVTGVSGGGATVLNALLSSSNPLALQLQNLDNEQQVRNAAEQLRPETNGASMQAVLGVTDKVQGLVDTRLDNVHLASMQGKRGIATGDQANGSGLWVQAFGFQGDQDRRSGVDGYNANAFGFAAGADTLLSGEKVRVGAALSYANSNIEDDGQRRGNRTDIDSFQGTVYSSWLFDGWYLNGSVGIGQHQFDSKKLVLNNAVSGNHDAWQYGGKLDAGRPFRIGNATLVPVASVAYSHLSQDSYTEKGIGAQRVSQDDTDSLRTGFGAKAILPLMDGGVRAGLELRAIWLHEFGDRSQDTTAQFTGGGSSFTVKGVRLARDAANLGASLKFSGTNDGMEQSLAFSYDAEVKSQYVSHTGRVQARFDF